MSDSEDSFGPSFSEEAALLEYQLVERVDAQLSIEKEYLWRSRSVRDPKSKQKATRVLSESESEDFTEALTGEVEEDTEDVNTG